MKVLHLLQSSQFSGAENVVCQIIKLMEKQSDIEMAYCSADGSIRDALKQRKIKFIPIQKLCRKEIRRVIEEFSPDIIHAHDIRASVLSAFCTPKSIKIISHIHGKFADMKKVTVKSVFYLVASNRFEKIICVSNSIMDEYIFQRYIRNKFVVLYNVIDDLALFRKAMMDTNTYDYDIVFVGRLCDVKNPERLYKVLKMCIASNSGIKTAIIGTGEYEKNLEKKIQKDGLNLNIKLLGFMSNPLKVVKSSKVMIMTSKTEGTPMCALEAMAFGIPIVSTPTDGLKELVDNKSTGYLSSEDIELSNSLCLICLDDKLQKKMSINTKEKFKKINDLKKYKDVVLSMYKEVCSGDIKCKN